MTMCTGRALLKNGGDKMSIGAKLRNLRGEKTQEQVATAIGVTKSAYAMYERDERVPRDEIKKKIADFYHTTVGIIFFAQ